MTDAELERWNKAFLKALKEADEEITPALAAAVAIVLRRFGRTVSSRVSAIRELSDGRGSGVPEWRVPTAIELRAAFDNALREALPEAVSSDRKRAIAIIADRITGPFGLDERAPTDAIFRQILADSDSRLIANATNRTRGIPRDIWWRMSAELQEAYNEGEGVRPAARRIREMVDGVNRQTARGRRLVEQSRSSDPKVAARAKAKLDGWAKWRSQTIARTEIVGVSNATSLAVAEAENVATHKSWLATDDDRTRDSHVEINGEKVEIDAPFSNDLLYPGDPRGAPKEVINCRCTHLFLNENEQGAGDVDSSPLSAAAFPVANPIPASWFDPYPLAEGVEVGERNEDGYRPIVGRAWFNEQCLLHGQQGRTCVKPKDFALEDNHEWFHSLTGYAVETDDGLVKPGPMILRHAEELNDADKAKETMDDPERIVAVVRIHLDDLGAIYSGAVLPHVDQDIVALMPAAQVSPEWWPTRPNAPYRMACLSLVSRGALPQTPEAIKASAVDGSPVFGLSCGCADKGEAEIETHPDIAPVMRLDDLSDEPGTFRLNSETRIAAAVDSPDWEAVLIKEGVPTADGRLIEANALTWRDTPLPLNLDHGDSVASIVGRIDDIWRDADLIRARGVFDDSDVGREAARLVADEMVTGVSIELGNIDATELDGTVKVTEDGVRYSDDVRFVFHHAKILAVGLVQVPAADEGQIEIADAAPDPESVETGEPGNGLSFVDILAKLKVRKSRKR